MREMVGWGNHGCVVWVVRNVMNHAPTAGAWLLIKCFFVGAERDESRPYGWRMAAYPFMA